MWSSPISARTPPCFEVPAKLAWRKTSPVGRRPALPYQSPNTPSNLPSPRNSACCEPQIAVAAMSSLTPAWNRTSYLSSARWADELQVEGAERRSAIAGHIARGIEAGPAVALLLHQAQAHDRLKAGDEDPAFGEVVFVVERDVVERHRARLRGIASLRGTTAAGIFDSFQGYRPSGGGSNAKKLRSLAISRRAPPRQRSFGPSARRAFWRNAAQRSHAARTSRQCLCAGWPRSEACFTTGVKGDGAHAADHA